MMQPPGTQPDPREGRARDHLHIVATLLVQTRCLETVRPILPEGFHVASLTADHQCRGLIGRQAVRLAGFVAARTRADSARRRECPSCLNGGN